MRRFNAAFMMQLGRVLRRKAVVVCLLLMIALALLLGAALGPDDESAMLVGVYLPPDSEKAAEIGRLLGGYSDGQTGFILAESEEQLREMVAGRVWECGYVFDAEMDEKLARGEYDRLLTRVLSPASTPLFSGWAVKAAVLEVTAQDIADVRLLAEGLELGGEPARLANAIFADSARMGLDIQPLYGADGAVDVKHQNSPALVRGLMALLLFLMCILAVVRYADDRESGFFKRLAPCTPPAVLFLSAYAGIGLLCLAAGFVCILLDGGWNTVWYETLLLILYLVLLGTVAFFLAGVFRRGQGLVALTPFLLVACLVLCPIFVDVSRWAPQLRVISWLLPPTLYLRGAAGMTQALWQLPLAAAVWFAAGLAVFALRSAKNSGSGPVAHFRSD